MPRYAEETSSRPAPPTLHGNHSKVIRHQDGFTWQGVPFEAYKHTTDTWRGVTRCELSGKRGESQAFHVRYFEIEPGGYSTLERHEHEHVVIPIRGRGEVHFGCHTYRVSFGDIVYIAPNDAHQFRNPEDSGEPFGFLCIVNAERDAPRPVDRGSQATPDVWGEGGLGPCHICE